VEALTLSASPNAESTAAPRFWWFVQVIPHSISYVSLEEGGGGNRISEEQIKSYLTNVLGEAPKPEWGVPGGWGTYLSGAEPSVPSKLLCCAAVVLRHAVWHAVLHPSSEPRVL
jgi:hypothetical protein